MTSADLVDAAWQAVDAAHQNPRAALEAARDLLERPDADEQVRSLAAWAAGLAHRELNQLADADRHLREAIDAGSRAGHDRIAAGARTSRALVLSYTGRLDEGLAELDRAEPFVTGAELGRVHMQRALILQRQGRLPAAIEAFRAALPELLAAGDRLAETRLRVNLGIGLAYTGDIVAAEHELRTARRAALELSQTMLAAGSAHNLGFVAGRRGDVPAALRWFDAAAAEYSDLGVESGLAAVLLVDRATVLLDAGLAAEAARATERAVELLAPTGNSVELAEARLLAARAALTAGSGDAAGHAAAAAAGFAATQRTAWSVLAEWVGVQAGGATPAETAALAEQLAGQGWTVEAAEAHGRAGALAADAGDHELATAELAAAAGSRHGGSAAARVAGWHAEALGRRLAGDRRGARRAVRTGLAELHRHRATLGATDLRAHSARYGERLADLAVADALAHGGAGDLLQAAEAWRAGSLATPARPPDDPGIAAALGRLRAVTARRREEPGAAADAELRRVEDEVRDLVRARPGADDATPLVPITRAELAATLGDRLLIEWVAHRGALHAVVFDRGRARRFDLGPVGAARDAIASIRMCLQRLAIGTGSARSLAAARSTAVAAAADAERALFGPLAPRLRERELVLVPTGALHAMPWLALDAVRPLAVSVAPSARAWLAASGRAARDGLLLAAGPRLPGAAAEIAALARALPAAIVLDPAAATVEAVLAALGRVGVAHIAAHGSFRADNPQFSSLQLADGDLTVYDLETLPQAPRLLVLSACDAATTGVRAGDELLGLSAALLAAGAGALVAPSVPVPDDITAALMVTLQLLVAEGVAPAAALRDAVGAASDDADPRSFAAMRSFVTWGA